MRVRVHECLGSLLTRVRRCREAERVCNESTTRKRHHRDGATTPLLPLEPPAKAIMTPQSSAGQHSRYINVSPSPTPQSETAPGQTGLSVAETICRKLCLLSPSFFPSHDCFFARLLSPMRRRKTATYVQQCHLEVTHCHTTVQWGFFSFFFSVPSPSLSTRGTVTLLSIQCQGL